MSAYTRRSETRASHRFGGNHDHESVAVSVFTHFSSIVQCTICSDFNYLNGESENVSSASCINFFSDMNLSKLVDEDEPLFMSLIEDMFPGIKLTTQPRKELLKAIENATVALGIMNHSEWNLKTIQVYLLFIILFLDFAHGVSYALVLRAY